MVNNIETTAIIAHIIEQIRLQKEGTRLKVVGSSKTNDGGDVGWKFCLVWLVDC